MKENIIEYQNTFFDIYNIKDSKADFAFNDCFCAT